MFFTGILLCVAALLAVVGSLATLAFQWDPLSLGQWGVIGLQYALLITGIVLGLVGKEITEAADYY